MFVPATPAPSAATLDPVGILSTALLAAPPIQAAAGTDLSIHRADLNILEGHPATVRGTLQGPLGSAGLSGRIITLQALGARGWRALARARTTAGGSFRLRYIPHRIGSERVRLRFAGDAHDLGTHRRLGQLNVHRLEGASASKAMCVANRESSLNWHIVNPPYSGGFQFTDEAWRAAGGGRFSSTAAGATPEQQMLVFSQYEPSHPGAWPVTVPACS